MRSVSSILYTTEWGASWSYSEFPNHMMVFFCMYLRVLLLMIKMTSSFFLRFDCVILSCQVRSAAERSATSVATQGSTAAVFCIVRINGKIVFRQALDSQGHQIFFATCCPAKRKDNSNQCLRRSSGEPRYVSTLVSPVLVCYYMLIIYIHAYIYTYIYIHTYIYIIECNCMLQVATPFC